MVFTVDLNGTKKPNIFGKDLFQFVLVPDQNIIRAHTYMWLYRNGSGEYTYCNKGGATGCAHVIEVNGWVIPEDYPIKF